MTTLREACKGTNHTEVTTMCKHAANSIECAKSGLHNVLLSASMKSDDLTDLSWL